MSTIKKTIHFYKNRERTKSNDDIALEKPLQIVLRKTGEPVSKSLPFAITMRSPGDDKDLVVGQLYSEGVIETYRDIVDISIKSIASNNIVVMLQETIDLSPWKNHRNLIRHSGCGVCGQTSLDFLEKSGPYLNRPGLPKLSLDLFPRLLQLLNDQEGDFHKTGGVHATALFDKTGKLLKIYEDIGRHNSMDKLVGWALRKSLLPLKDNILLFSGRSSYELIQKAQEAGISVIASIGAPSSLAIEMAEEHGMTLIGFLKNNQFNLYCDNGRIINNDL